MKKRLIASIVEIIVGILLFGGGLAGVLDEFWNSMGVALMVVGTLQVLRCIRYRNDEAYRTNFDIESKDERNRYISMKAWSWAGYWFVMITAVGSIVFKIIGMDEMVPIASGSVCLIILLYWLSYLYLKKKY